MKLKDILKINTNKIGWLKVFKKLGADNETMKFVNDNVGKESSDDGGGNSNIELTKGKKILSEYYYFDVFKLTEGVSNGSIPSDFMQLLINYMSLDSGYNQVQKEVAYMKEIGYMNSGFGLSESNHVIYKVITEDIVIYYEDNMPQVSGEFDVAQVAIRKYCKGYPPLGSGPEQYSTLNIYISINELFDCTDRFPAPFDEMIAPYLITEEEFWAEAKIINDINEILP